jgi:hypothetical protein
MPDPTMNRCDTLHRNLLQSQTMWSGMPTHVKLDSVAEGTADVLSPSADTSLEFSLVALTEDPASKMSETTPSSKIEDTGGGTTEPKNGGIQIEPKRGDVMFMLHDKEKLREALRMVSTKRGSAALAMLELQKALPENMSIIEDVDTSHHFSELSGESATDGNSTKQEFESSPPAMESGRLNRSQEQKPPLHRPLEPGLPRIGCALDDTKVKFDAGIAQIGTDAVALMSEEGTRTNSEMAIALASLLNTDTKEVPECLPHSSSAATTASIIDGVTSKTNSDASSVASDHFLQPLKQSLGEEAMKGIRNTLDSETEDANRRRITQGMRDRRKKRRSSLCPSELAGLKTPSIRRSIGEQTNPNKPVAGYLSADIERDRLLALAQERRESKRALNAAQAALLTTETGQQSTVDCANNVANTNLTRSSTKSRRKMKRRASMSTFSTLPVPVDLEDRDPLVKIKVSATILEDRDLLTKTRTSSTAAPIISPVRAPVEATAAQPTVAEKTELKQIYHLQDALDPKEGPPCSSFKQAHVSLAPLPNKDIIPFSVEALQHVDLTEHSAGLRLPVRPTTQEFSDCQYNNLVAKLDDNLASAKEATVSNREPPAPPGQPISVERGTNASSDASSGDDEKKSAKNRASRRKKRRNSNWGCSEGALKPLRTQTSLHRIEKTDSKVFQLQTCFVSMSHVISDPFDAKMCVFLLTMALLLGGPSAGCRLGVF